MSPESLRRDLEEILKRNPVCDQQYFREVEAWCEEFVENHLEFALRTVDAETLLKKAIELIECNKKIIDALEEDTITAIVEYYLEHVEPDEFAEVLRRHRQTLIDTLGVMQES